MVQLAGTPMHPRQTHHPRKDLYFTFNKHVLAYDLLERNILQLGQQLNNNRLAIKQLQQADIRMCLHDLGQPVDNKSVARCQQTCCKLIAKTCYPQACCKLFQQVLASLCCR